MCPSLAKKFMFCAPSTIVCVNEKSDSKSIFLVDIYLCSNYQQISQSEPQKTLGLLLGVLYVPCFFPLLYYCEYVYVDTFYLTILQQIPPTFYMTRVQQIPTAFSGQIVVDPPYLLSDQIVVDPPYLLSGQIVVDTPYLLSDQIVVDPPTFYLTRLQQIPTNFYLTRLQQIPPIFIRMQSMCKRS